MIQVEPCFSSLFVLLKNWRIGLYQSYVKLVKKSKYLIRISIGLVVLELWSKICQNENFRHFPRPRKKHKNEAKIKVTMIILGLSSVLANFYKSGIFSSFFSSNTARSLPVWPYLKTETKIVDNRCAK